MVIELEKYGAQGQSDSFIGKEINKLRDVATVFTDYACVKVGAVVPSFFCTIAQKIEKLKYVGNVKL